jgi:wobble nucleotide-excising tRNase
LSGPADIDDLLDECQSLLSQKPPVQNTIEFLQNNPSIANWVESGLPLHNGSPSCHFCGSSLREDHIAHLQAHFSKDLENFRGLLRKAIDAIGLRKIKANEVSPTALYSQFRTELANHNAALTSAKDRYNDHLEELTKALHLKLNSPFSEVQVPARPAGVEASLSAAVTNLNELIKRSNALTSDFDGQKRTAVLLLKRHYAAEYYYDSNVDLRERKIKLYGNHLNRLTAFGQDINREISELEAKINQAQKGREEINRRISTILGHDCIEIDVVREGDADRFRLMRGTSIAKNLSEGEKTAIAFAFFITKLKDLKNPASSIVYIDDPISSLDSNHIFQINSIIKNEFFHQAASSTEWKTNYGQLFISTHNFEFFGLLKELPGNSNKTRYYQTKRLTPEASTLINLPKSIEKYSSEYHYLFSILHCFHISEDKTDLAVLLGIPNAVRRFVELYTYSRIPSPTRTGVDERADLLFGAESSKRILKVLHYFSHANNIERIAKHTDLLCDIERAVAELIDHIKKDALHYTALLEAAQ